MKRYLNWCAATHKHDMLEQKDGPWIKYDDVAEALALLRELNDALAIPGSIQPRVDAVLDRAERQLSQQHRANIPCPRCGANEGELCKDFNHAENVCNAAKGKE